MNEIILKITTWYVVYKLNSDNMVRGWMPDPFERDRDVYLLVNHHRKFIDRV